DPLEFTNPTNPISSGGAVQFYRGVSGTHLGTRIDVNTPSDTVLWGGTALAGYDETLAPCLAQARTQTAAQLANLVSYVDGGGRFLTSHFGYEWLFHNTPLDTTATWAANTNNYPNPVTAIVNPGFSQFTSLSQWLVEVGASSTLGQVPIRAGKIDALSTKPPAETWLTAQIAPSTILQFGFDTPVGSTSHCGKVLYLDYHANLDGNTVNFFPVSCGASTISNNDWLFMYSLFSLEC